MMWYIVGTVLATVFVAILTHSKDKEDNLIPAVLMGAAVFLLVALGGSYIMGLLVTPSYYPVSSHELRTLDMDTLSHGNFFLGSGTIDEEPHYFYYEEVNIGAYQLKWVPAEESIIHEVDKESGALEVYRPSWKSQMLSLDYPNRYDFYVPVGSIKPGFNPNVR